MSLLENGESFAGILYKRGRINKAFKERWFVVSRFDQTMKYFESESKSSSKSNCLGYIDLALVQNIEVLTTNKYYDSEELPEFIRYHRSSSMKKAFLFQMITSHRTYVLSAINEVDLFQWIQFLSISLYGAIIKEDYVKKQEGAALNRAWKVRYCVLNEYRQLKWYRNKDRHKYLGFIDCNTLSSISNGRAIASQLGYILDLYTRYGNVWYIGCKNEMERNEWNKHLTHFVNENGGNERKENDESIFGNNLIFEEKCKSISKCHSISRIIKCLLIWNGNGDELSVNKLLSQNMHFVKDYHHILNVHLETNNEFDGLNQYILQQTRYIHTQQSHKHLTMPNESQQNTFYVNAMYVIHCYFFGNLV